MKRMIQMVIAVLVILGAGYWIYTAVAPIRYSGSNIMFPIGSGHVVIKNLGDEPMPIEMRSGERARSFRIASADLGIAQSAKREGTGRAAYYTTSFDLPPGQARIDVVSGGDVRLIARGDTRIEASVKPMAASTVRWAVILSSAAIVWALYSISRLTEHRWLSALRGKAAGGALQPKQTTG
ncbi:MAG: hypothetical protein DCC57_01630 [Chloroflexi bacterium]|nr:MAG: hypothetical protein DCC57_01630 [Chloroflexota bacterium]